MDESSVLDYITKTFPGVETSTTFGYTFFTIDLNAYFPSQPLSPQTRITIAFPIWTARECFA